MSLDLIPMRFGKHKGRTPRQLFSDGEYSYLIWVYENINDVVSDNLYDSCILERLSEDNNKDYMDCTECDIY